MSTLDSRFLKLGDCFAQKFSTPGTVKYIVTAGTGGCLRVGESAYTIEVKPGGSKKAKGKGSSTQQNVIVRLQGTTLTAEPGHLEIKVGDTVLWHTPDAAAPGFVVVGEGGKNSFNSGALSVESVYSHAFGAPGTYEWVDANGRSVHGVVRVKNFEVKKSDDYCKWMESLSKGVLIHVVGGKSEPSRVDIFAGQTVFWAVERASGISITDSRFLFRG
jgi:plastocyanin